MRTHTWEKLYQCSQYGMAVSDNSSHIRYITTHTGEKPYQCSQCNNAFSDNSLFTLGWADMLAIAGVAVP